MRLESYPSVDEASRLVRAVAIRKTRRFVTGSEDVRVRDFIKDKTRRQSVQASAFARQLSEKAVKQTRKLVTGHEDHTITEMLRKERVIRSVDKLAFSSGVLLCAGLQHCLEHSIARITGVYVTLIPVLLVLRYFLWRKRKWEIFLADFCYFVNCLLMASILFLDVEKPPSWAPRLWQCLFVFSVGPVGIATVVWRCSLVFHSIDKVTTVLVHVLPACIMTKYRWERPELFGELDATGWFLYPLAGYAVWQIAQLILTEVVLADYLQKNPDALTSLRQLIDWERHKLNIFATRICKLTGSLNDDQKLCWRARPLQANVVFVSMQLLYTLITIAPLWPLFQFEYLNKAFVALVCAASVREGASFYIEIFAERYVDQFKDKGGKKEK